MKAYKVLFFISLFLNFIMGFLVYRIPSDYHLRYLKEAKYLLAFAEEVIVENRAKVNPDSKFMKKYILIKADESKQYDRYLFDLNKDVQIDDAKSDAGFIVKVDKDNAITSIGWFKP